MLFNLEKRRWGTSREFGKREAEYGLGIVVALALGVVGLKLESRVSSRTEGATGRENSVPTVVPEDTLFQEITLRENEKVFDSTTGLSFGLHKDPTGQLVLEVTHVRTGLAQLLRLVVEGSVVGVGQLVGMECCTFLDGETELTVKPFEINTHGQLVIQAFGREKESE